VSTFRWAIWTGSVDWTEIESIGSDQIWSDLGSEVWYMTLYKYTNIKLLATPRALIAVVLASNTGSANLILPISSHMGSWVKTMCSMHASLCRSSCYQCCLLVNMAVTLCVFYVTGLPPISTMPSMLYGSHDSYFS
jgi:hypothetical protein